MKLLAVSVVLLFVCMSGDARSRRSFFVPSGTGNGCGYASCPAYNASALINVHLVPHSHDDVGWLKTVDQYYFGSKMSIQRAGVQYILDSVIKELSLDPTKRYIQVETAFFWRWWHEQNDLMKDMTRQLVEEGRLEFVGGGWSMNDEATTHYSGIIDNMAFGFKTLQDLFGQCSVPKVAWQIDPFGHSREQARLFAWMGFDGLFFARADFRDKAQRKVNKTLQMIWQGSGKEEGNEDSALFTGMFSDHYSHPDGLCFDVLCTDDPIIDNLELEGNNVEERMFTVLSNVLNEVDYFQGPGAKHIMFTMGDDFTYQNARQNYKNMDKMIKHANERLAEHGINVFYSTPSCYIKALHDESISQNVTAWPTKTDDFFPYANRNNSYWTGYFTSRPTLKYMERYTNALLQVSKQVEAMFEFRGLVSGIETDVDILRRAMATMQHHDAVTGTEKQQVAEDYAQRMIEGTEAVLSQVGPALFGLTGLAPPEGYTDFLCPLLNISQCHLTEENKQLSMIIYNPLAHSASRILRFPIPAGSQVKIYNSDGEPLNVNLVPIPQEVLKLPGRTSTAQFDAVFLVSDIPALGFRAFYVNIEPSKRSSSPVLTQKVTRMPEDDILKAFALDFQFQYYISSSDLTTQPSGAYIFRPDTNEKVTVVFDTIETFESELVSEIRYSSNSTDWASVIVRRNLGDPHFEVEWMAGPLPKVQPGLEVVMTYRGLIEEKTRAEDPVEFWTDSNGRQMVRRLKDNRFSYELEHGNLEPVASNYYPVTASIKTNLLSNGVPTGEVMSVLNDRSQGGSCLNVNECELMIHRRTFVDDRYGVGEALDEQAFGLPLVARGKHLIFLGTQDEESEWRRSFSQELYLPSFLFFLPTEVSLESWLALTAVKEFRGINVESLPSNVHILTLERWGSYDANEILVRFEHFYEEGEHSELSDAVSFELTEDFFTTIQIQNVREVSLGGNVDLKEMKESRLKWNDKSQTKEGQTSNLELPLSITLQPMEIRTFILQLSQKQNDVILEVITP